MKFDYRYIFYNTKKGKYKIFRFSNFLKKVFKMGGRKSDKNR